MNSLLANGIMNLLHVVLFWFVSYGDLRLQVHIKTLRGRILETILSLRFLIFQYGIVYNLHLTGKDTSLAVRFMSFILHSYSPYPLYIFSN